MWSHSVFRDTGVPLLILAPSGRISSANPAAQELVGRRCLTGTDLGDLVAGPDRTILDPFVGALATLPAGQGQSFGPIRVQWRGQSQQVQLTGSRASDPHGFDALVVAVQVLPEPLAAPVGELDPLTGVGTRTRGLRTLEAEVSADAPGTILVLDLDGFEEVNTTFGFSEGDRILAEIAERLVRATPPGSSVARLDGDMFLVVSPRTPLAAAEDLAGVLLAALARPLHIAGTRVVTVSIGAAGLAGDRPDEVLIRAQSALAIAKEQGGHQVVIDGPAPRTYGRRHSDRETAVQIRALQSEVERATAEAERARAEARTDALTQLANRRAYDEEVGQLQARMRRTGASAAALFIDLDWFGEINRALGQHRGDMALLAVAAVLTDTSRSEDLLFRHGGEEFVVLLPDADLDAGLVVAERLRAAVQGAAIPHWGRPDLPIVTVSIGVSAGTAAQRTVIQLVNDANEQMRLAKARGRNQVSPQLPRQPQPSTGSPAGDDAA